MLTPEQSRAARALLEWSQDRLATEARVARQTVVDFERGAREPTAGSLTAMRKAFEAARVEFSEGAIGIGIRLLPSIWHLKPADISSVNWKASTYCGETIIRACSERQAREIATKAFGIAVRRYGWGETPVNPWSRISGEVLCDRLIGSDFPEDGASQMLAPAIADGSTN